MAPRANWKGVLKIGEVSCAVALYTAASTSDRIAFHTINRKTGNRVRREFVDAETGQPVEREAQVKGYALSGGEHIVFQPDEIAQAIPDSDKVLSVAAFLDCDAIDPTYFDKSYYLAPSGPEAQEAFALIRDGMRATKTAAIARTVLFRRLRTLLIRAQDRGLVARTLNFDYEVRSAEEAFEEIPQRKIGGEMLDLARHIIKTKAGAFDPALFDDRYEAALEELVKALIAGREPKRRPKAKPGKVVDLLEALRESARQAGPSPGRKRKAG